MSSSSGTLQFILSTHGNAVLSKMTVLREEHRFCDVTLVLGGPQASSVRPVRFHGHRVVLAASSDFLRDQFLLHEGQAELSVGVVSDVNIAQMLLLSCYTGFLEVPLGELVSYLTAASALHINQVVNKCAQAVSQYLGPALAFLKLEGPSNEKETQQLDSSWPETSTETREEKDAAQPGACIQEANTQEGGAVLVQPKLRVSQEEKVARQTLGAIRGEVEVMRVALSGETACCLNTLETEEGGNSPPLHSNNTLFRVHHAAGTLQCKLHPPANFQDRASSSLSRSSAGGVKPAESSRKQQEPEAEEENVCTFGAQVQQDEKIMNFSGSCLSKAHPSKSHFAADEAAGDPGGRFVQRPYLCRRCDKVFQHFGSYVGHLKEHRHVYCLVCGKQFSQKSQLTRHVSVHAGAKPFRCPLCHKTFIQRARLQDHINLHTEDKQQKRNHSGGSLAHKSGPSCHARESSLESVLEGTVDIQ